MNAMCEVCRHYWYDKTGRREVAWLFAGARSRLGAVPAAIAELDGMEREVSRLCETHLCVRDGIEPTMGEDEAACEWWEAVA